MKTPSIATPGRQRGGPAAARGLRWHDRHPPGPSRRCSRPRPPDPRPLRSRPRCPAACRCPRRAERLHRHRPPRRGPERRPGLAGRVRRPTSPAAGQTITLQLTGSLSITDRTAQSVTNARRARRARPSTSSSTTPPGFTHNFFIGTADAAGPEPDRRTCRASRTGRAASRSSTTWSPPTPRTSSSPAPCPATTPRCTARSPSCPDALTARPTACRPRRSATATRTSGRSTGSSPRPEPTEEGHGLVVLDRTVFYPGRRWAAVGSGLADRGRWHLAGRFVAPAATARTSCTRSSWSPGSRCRRSARP